MKRTHAVSALKSLGKHAAAIEIEHGTPMGDLLYGALVSKYRGIVALIAADHGILDSVKPVYGDLFRFLHAGMISRGTSEVAEAFGMDKREAYAVLRGLEGMQKNAWGLSAEQSSHDGVGARGKRKAGVKTVGEELLWIFTPTADDASWEDVWASIEDDPFTWKPIPHASRSPYTSPVPNAPETPAATPSGPRPAAARPVGFPRGVRVEPERKKYGSALTVQRQKLLDDYIAENPAALEEDWDGLPKALRTKIEGGKPHELLWSDVNRYLSDKLSEKRYGREKVLTEATARTGLDKALHGLPEVRSYQASNHRSYWADLRDRGASDGEIVQFLRKEIPHSGGGLFTGGTYAYGRGASGAEIRLKVDSAEWAFDVDALVAAVRVLYSVETTPVAGAPPATDLSVEERVARAADLGRAAFLAGAKRTPAQDPALAPLLSGLAGPADPAGAKAANRILDAWLSAWDRENVGPGLAAPSSETYGEGDPDPRPATLEEAYFVTARDASNPQVHAILTGPFETHAAALADVPRAKHFVHTHFGGDVKAAFAAIGTARAARDRVTVFTGDGAVNPAWEAVVAGGPSRLAPDALERWVRHWVGNVVAAEMAAGLSPEDAALADNPVSVSLAPHTQTITLSCGYWPERLRARLESETGWNVTHFPACLRGQVQQDEDVLKLLKAIWTTIGLREQALERFETLPRTATKKERTEAQSTVDGLGEAIVDLIGKLREPWNEEATAYTDGDDVEGLKVYIADRARLLGWDPREGEADYKQRSTSEDVRNFAQGFVDQCLEDEKAKGPGPERGSDRSFFERTYVPPVVSVVDEEAVYEVTVTTNYWPERLRQALERVLGETFGRVNVQLAKPPQKPVAAARPSSAPKSAPKNASAVTNLDFTPPKPGSKEARYQSEDRDGIERTMAAGKMPSRLQKHLTQNGFPGYEPVAPVRNPDTYLQVDGKNHPAVVYTFLNRIMGDMIAVYVAIDVGRDEYLLRPVRGAAGAGTSAGQPEPKRALALGHGYASAGALLAGIGPEELTTPDYVFREGWLQGLLPTWGDVRLAATSPGLARGNADLLKALRDAGLDDFLAAEGVSHVHIPGDDSREDFDIMKVPPSLGTTWSDTLPLRAIAIQHVSRGDLDNQAVITLQRTPKGDYRVASILHTAVGWKLSRPSSDAEFAHVWGENLAGRYSDLIREAIQDEIRRSRHGTALPLVEEAEPASAQQGEALALLAEFNAVPDGKVSVRVPLADGRSLHIGPPNDEESRWVGRVCDTTGAAPLGADLRREKTLIELMTWIRSRVAFASAAEGDKLYVTFRAASSSSPDEQRTVTVQSRTEEGNTIFVSSGKVRPGSVAGGIVVDYGSTGGLQFQPTLQQAVRPIKSLTIAERAGGPGGGGEELGDNSGGNGGVVPSGGTPVTVQRTQSVDRSRASYEALASDYKARGLDLSAAYNELVRDRNLNPGINLKDFRRVFEAARPHRLAGETTTETVGFTPTHFDAVTEHKVMITPKPNGGWHVLWHTGYEGGHPPGALPNRYQPLNPEVWQQTFHEWFQANREILQSSAQDVSGGGISVSYNYTSPGSAGPNKGTLVVSAKDAELYRKGMTIQAPFGTARVTSTRKAEALPVTAKAVESYAYGVYWDILRKALSDGHMLPFKVLGQVEDLRTEGVTSLVVADPPGKGWTPFRQEDDGIFAERGDYRIYVASDGKLFARHIGSEGKEYSLFTGGRAADTPLTVGTQFGSVHEVLDAVEAHATSRPATNSRELVVGGETLLQVVNEAGRPFRIRVVLPGMRYGRDDQLVYEPSKRDRGDVLIQFYDASPSGLRMSPRGQHVSDYARTTLRDTVARGEGILLDGSNPVWTVSAENTREAVAFSDRISPEPSAPSGGPTSRRSTPPPADAGSTAAPKPATDKDVLYLLSAVEHLSGHTYSLPWAAPGHPFVLAAESQGLIRRDASQHKLRWIVTDAGKKFLGEKLTGSVANQLGWRAAVEARTAWNDHGPSRLDPDPLRFLIMDLNQIAAGLADDLYRSDRDLLLSYVIETQGMSGVGPGPDGDGGGNGGRDGGGDTANSEPGSSAAEPAGPEGWTKAGSYHSGSWDYDQIRAWEESRARTVVTATGGLAREVGTAHGWTFYVEPAGASIRVASEATAEINRRTDLLLTQTPTSLQVNAVRLHFDARNTHRVAGNGSPIYPWVDMPQATGVVRDVSFFPGEGSRLHVELDGIPGALWVYKMSSVLDLTPVPAHEINAAAGEVWKRVQAQEDGRAAHAATFPSLRTDKSAPSYWKTLRGHREVGSWWNTPHLADIAQPPGKSPIPVHLWDGTPTRIFQPASSNDALLHRVDLGAIPSEHLTWKENADARRIRASLRAASIKGPDAPVGADLPDPPVTPGWKASRAQFRISVGDAKYAENETFKTYPRYVWVRDDGKVRIFLDVWPLEREPGLEPYTPTGNAISVAVNGVEEIPRVPAEVKTSLPAAFAAVIALATSTYAAPAGPSLADASETTRLGDWMIGMAGKEIVIYRGETAGMREVARVIPLGSFGGRTLMVVGTHGRNPPAGRDTSAPEMVGAPDFTPARVWGGERTTPEAGALIRRYMPQLGFPEAATARVFISFSDGSRKLAADGQAPAAEAPKAPAASAPVFHADMSIRDLILGAEPGVEALFARVLGEVPTLPNQKPDAPVRAGRALYGGAVFIAYLKAHGYQPVSEGGGLIRAWNEHTWKSGGKDGVPVPEVTEEALAAALRSDEGATELVRAVTGRKGLRVKSERSGSVGDWSSDIYDEQDHALGGGSGKTRKEAIGFALSSRAFWERIWKAHLEPYLLLGEDRLGRLKAALLPSTAEHRPAHPSGFATGHVADPEPRRPMTRPPEVAPAEGARKPRERVDTDGCQDISFDLDGETVKVTCGAIGKKATWHNIQVSGGPKKLFFGWSGERWSRGEIPPDSLLRAIRAQGVTIFPDPDARTP